MKHEWKKHEREIYGVNDKPQLITMPSQSYIMIKGHGNPNQADFSERVGVLYSLAWPIKMRFKALCKEDPKLRSRCQFNEYAIYPLEGRWMTDNTGDLMDKDCFHYTIMIKQPDCITKEMFEAALEITAGKKPHPFLKEVEFGTIEDGLCIQILHKGSYDDEPETFARMDVFAEENGLKRTGGIHREIYLTDPRKTEQEKRKTILRYQVQCVKV